MLGLNTLNHKSPNVYIMSNVKRNKNSVERQKVSKLMIKDFVEKSLGF